MMPGVAETAGRKNACPECGFALPAGRKPFAGRFCSHACCERERGRSNHPCPSCMEPQVPTDVEKHGCIVRTWRCQNCDGGGGA